MILYKFCDCFKYIHSAETMNIFLILTFFSGKPWKYSKLKKIISVACSKRTYQVRPVRPLFSRKLLKIPQLRSKTIHMPQKNRSLGEVQTYRGSFKLLRNSGQPDLCLVNFCVNIGWCAICRRKLLFSLHIKLWLKYKIGLNIPDFIVVIHYSKRYCIFEHIWIRYSVKRENWWISSYKSIHIKCQYVYKTRSIFEENKKSVIMLLVQVLLIFGKEKKSISVTIVQQRLFYQFQFVWQTHS